MQEVQSYNAFSGCHKATVALDTNIANAKIWLSL